jgi:hypothetical protein
LMVLLLLVVPKNDDQKFLASTFSQRNSIEHKLDDWKEHIKTHGRKSLEIFFSFFFQFYTTPMLVGIHSLSNPIFMVRGHLIYLAPY